MKSTTTYRNLVRSWLVLLCVCSIGFGYGQSTSLFEQGKEHYKAEAYQEAIAVWMRILDSDQHSAALYYNLGNAHYKLNQIGPSVYYYEKALQLSPGNSDIKNNLAFAQNATVDAIEPLPETVFQSWNRKISGLFSYDGWAWLAVLACIGFVVLFLGYYFSYSERKKRILFASSMGCILITLVALSLAFKTYNDAGKDQPAIVFAESSEVKSEPTLGSAPAFTLHEGTKVQILETDDDWVRIRIADGKDGWMPLEDLRVL